MSEHRNEMDPRRVRSRNRLLDAAASLLSSGGVEAVTVDAVTRVSRVARTTLYRHFTSSTELVAAALERMLPEVVFPDFSGLLQSDLVAALDWLAEQIEEAPVKLTTVGWLAMSAKEGDQAKEDDQTGAPALVDLRDRIIAQYRTPFDIVFDSDAGRAELGDLDRDLAFAQLAGPVILSRLTGGAAITIDAMGRRRIVDDFLLAHASKEPSSRNP